MLRDLESRQGTFIGDARAEIRQIEDKTEFRLGSTRFLLHVAARD